MLTDSDGAGKQIRSFLNGIVPKDKIYNLYIPKIEGKERRKSSPSKEGYLGVEGMSREELVRILSPFILNNRDSGERLAKARENITKVDFYRDKLTGFDNSSLRRDELARLFDLPSGMTPNALLDALNIIVTREEYAEAVKKLG